MNTHELKTRSQNIANIVDEYRGELINNLVDYLNENDSLLEMNIELEGTMGLSSLVTTYWTAVTLEENGNIVFHYGGLFDEEGSVELSEMPLDTLLYILSNIN